MKVTISLFSKILISFLIAFLPGSELHSAKLVTEHGLPGCIELNNGSTRVVLDPNIGGRVLVYEIDGKNILFLDEALEGITDGYSLQRVDAGRFDFGPTRVLPKRDLYFKGTWEAEITGELSARMVSQVDPALNVLVVREFELDNETSRLICTQTLTNVGKETKYLFCWGRTFVHGGGISLNPVNPHSRYPSGHVGYLRCDNQTVMVFDHAEDPNLRVRDNVLEVFGTTHYSKFVMDSEEGWMAYLSPEDLLYIKTFEIYPEKKYGEMTAATTSIWQYNHQIYEIEPYGPMEQVEPGQSISFTEHWDLMAYPFPEDKLPDLKEIRKKVADLK